MPTSFPQPVKFSIVIDNYNYGRFLTQAIDSCLAQTLPAHEIIVVDDGSTDNSREILARYEGIPNVTVILQANQGQEAALQHGIDRATGDWILGLDSDDYYHPGCLAEIARHIAPGIDWIYFGATVVDAENRTIGARPDPKMTLMQGAVWRSWITEGRTHTFPPQSFHCYSAKFIRTTRLFPNPDVNLRTAITPDRYLSLLAAFDCQAVAIADRLGCYREHNSDYKLTAKKLPGIRTKLRQQVIAEGIVTRKLAAAGIALQPQFYADSAPSHWRHRLISLVHEPAEHPYPSDTRWRIFRQILAAYTRERPFRPLRLLKAFFQCGAIALMPRGIALKIHDLPSFRQVLTDARRRWRKPEMNLSKPA